MAAPTAVLEAAINQLGGQEEQHTLPSHVPSFVPTKRFAGAKPGYYFSLGKQGLGYYIDAKQPLPDVFDEEPTIAAQPRRRIPTAEELLRDAEQQAGEQQVQLLDAKSLKRLVLQLERKTQDNMEARLKHADQPEKFMDSEVDLFAALDAYKILSATPELYSEFVKLGGVAAYVQLLSHENNDIVGQVTELLRDMTDDDAVEEQVDDVKPLITALMDNNAPELLMQRLAGLDESQEEEEGAVGNIISLFGNMVEVDADVAAVLGEQTKLIQWLLQRIRVSQFTPNKQEAAELLAVLVQSSPINQRIVGQQAYLDGVLEAVAPYKSRDPATEMEEEFIDNLFDVVCACLMLDDNKPHFIAGEGVELMLLMLKNKRYARGGALRTLDFACTRNPVACERLVDKGGLRLVFPLFMGKARSKGKRRDDDDDGDADETRSLSLVSCLLQCLHTGGRRERVLAKFVDNEFEKVDRLMELYETYAGRVDDAEDGLVQAAEGGELDEDELLLARMDAGLFALQQTGDVGVKRRILTALHQRGDTLATVRQVLVEFWTNIGSEDGAKEQEAQRNQVWRMVTAMGGPAQPPAEEDDRNTANGEAAQGSKRPREDDEPSGEDRSPKAVKQ